MRAGLSAVIPALILVAIAVWEIVVLARAPGGVPGDDAWAQASDEVRARFAPGELIVFAPRWIDPVGRMHLGDLIPIEAAARMDAARFGVIWELSIRGARAPETAGLSPVWSGSFGGVTVRRFEREPAVVVADLVTLAATIETRGSRAGGPTVVLAEVGFEPHRCVQIEPMPPGGYELYLRLEDAVRRAKGEPPLDRDRGTTLDYGRVMLGSTLVGHVGLADVFTRRDVRHPGRLVLRIDGDVTKTITVGVDDGWHRFEVATTPGEHQVEVIASAIGPGARDRLICFAAEARR